ncbi:hypothetical protein Taro_045756 [Colocasia esculenta]|uniref:Uncharacterized protein n=1 Tax=Colocasia esculenta TaxID=4460 RepID=A0A843X0V7_COLES|nr:hypothetical protein [Colocasia esculenta]
MMNGVSSPVVSSELRELQLHGNWGRGDLLGEWRSGEQRCHRGDPSSSLKSFNLHVHLLEVAPPMRLRQRQARRGQVSTRLSSGRPPSSWGLHAPSPRREPRVLLRGLADGLALKAQELLLGCRCGSPTSPVERPGPPQARRRRG